MNSIHQLKIAIPRTLLFALLLSISFDCMAGKVCFGEADSFVELDKLNVPPEIAAISEEAALWASGNYRLGAHLRDRCFIAPYWSDNLGYAIYHVDYTNKYKGEEVQKYWQLNKDSLNSLQIAGVLPNPLPSNEVSFVHTNQFALILIIVGLGLLVGFSYLEVRRKNIQAQKVANKVDGSFINALREILADLPCPSNRIAAENQQRFIANILNHCGGEADIHIKDGRIQPRLCKRDELLTFIECYRETLNETQKSLIVMGVASVLSLNQIGFRQKKAFKSYLRAIGIPDKQIKKTMADCLKLCQEGWAKRQGWSNE